MIFYLYMLNVILIGPQGSGKGTQAEKIISEYGLTYIEMGSLIRARAKLPDKKAEIIDHLANKKGLLLPDGVVLDMISDELTDNISKTGYLFDGFPRTVNQYQALKQLLYQKHLKLTVVIYLNISDREAVKRLGSRRICDRCTKGYSLVLTPMRHLCECGGNLIERPDDSEEAIRQRLNLFHENTQPILDLIKQDNLFIAINAEQTVEKIYSDIKHLLDQKLQQNRLDQ
jgi:adenylate kinase